jgi:hypothetical protein
MMATTGFGGDEARNNGTFDEALFVKSGRRFHSSNYLNARQQ